MQQAATSGAISSRASSGASSSVLFARVGFIVIVACLLVFGLVMLYSASSVYSYNLTGSYSSVFYKQTIFVAIGIVIALVIAFIPHTKFSLPLCAILLAVTIPLLLLVLIGGNDALGARRWIDLGFTTLQPSEFTKIALILVMAHLVYRCQTSGYTRALIGVMIVACAIPVGLIIIEPDLGTTIIAVIGILAVLWFGGVPKRIVGILALALVVLAAVAIFGSGFRQNRISSWLDPWSDPQGSGYQLINSYYAFGGGGVFGVGLGLSKQKFNWLPQSENDFLFAIVGEELGLIGAIIIVLLFIGLVFMALRIARNAPDPFGAMIAAASGVIIGLQAFLNMLCVVGALPTTGKPLPFFSSGGSSIISTMILVGLILSVSLQSSRANAQDFSRAQFAVVDGGRQRSQQAGGSSLGLSWLPNPAAFMGNLRYTPSAQERRERPPSDKVVPISRGRAERSTREAQAREAQMRAQTREVQARARTQVQARGQSQTQDQTRTQVQAQARTQVQAQARTQLQPRAQTPLPTSRQRREAQQTPAFNRRDNAPISMTSLRRNRVPKSANGGKSA